MPRQVVIALKPAICRRRRTSLPCLENDDSTVYPSKRILEIKDNEAGVVKKQSKG